MGFNWKDEWENHSEEELKTLRKQKTSELLANIQTGWYGSYYNIWYVIAEKATAKEAVPTLLAALHQIEADKAVYYDQLQAIHCLTAICKLLNIPEKEAHEYIYMPNKQQAAQFLQNLFQQILSHST